MARTTERWQERSSALRFFKVTGELTKEVVGAGVVAGAMLSQGYQIGSTLVAIAGLWLAGHNWRKQAANSLETVVMKARPQSPEQLPFSEEEEQQVVRVGVVGDHLSKEFAAPLAEELIGRLGVPVVVFSEKAETNSSAERVEPQSSKLREHARFYHPNEPFDALVVAPGIKSDITGQKLDYTPVRNVLNDAADSRTHALLPSSSSPIAFVLLPNHTNSIAKNLPRLLRVGFRWVRPQFVRRGKERVKISRAIAEAHNEEARKNNEREGEFYRKEAEILDFSGLPLTFDPERHFHFNDGSKQGKESIRSIVESTADALEDGLRKVCGERGIPVKPKVGRPRRLRADEMPPRPSAYKNMQLHR